MTSIIINICLWTATILGYVIFNLYRKNEKLESMVLDRDRVLADLGTIIEESNTVLTEIDKLGAFKSDDEIGFFFNTLKNIQQTLNQFASNK